MKTKTSESKIEHNNIYNFITSFEHASLGPAAHWHRHTEYELHLVTSTSGKVFVGDYIGNYRPGNLILIGPNLPHHWVPSLPKKEPPCPFSRSLHFSGEPFKNSKKHFPELNQASELLEKAKHGVEFYDLSHYVLKQLIAIKKTTGIKSLIEFLALIDKLSEHTEFKILSNHHLQNIDRDNLDHKLSQIINYIYENYTTHFSMAEIAENFEMNKSTFSRYFKKSTGNNFTSFVNQLRINHACNLLTETNKYISTICYSVGYHNVANFNRRFYEYKRMTPTEYRIKSQLKYIRQ